MLDPDEKYIYFHKEDWLRNHIEKSEFTIQISQFGIPNPRICFYVWFPSQSPLWKYSPYSIS